MFAALTPDAWAFIVAEEGLAGRPYWPGGASGVTLDIGYDLGYHLAPQIIADWKPYFTPPQLDKLVACAGVRGEAASQQAQLLKLQGLWVKPEWARAVFEKSSMPLYQHLTERSFPGVVALPWQVQWALFSLVYNRGGLPVSSVIQPDGSSTDQDRYQMERYIRNAVMESHVPHIADGLEAMALDGKDTLWPGPKAPNPGLRGRRKREAALVRRAYT